MVFNKRQRSVVSMIAFTIFLAFMDIKDLYYKFVMTGPNSSWAFTADIHEVLTEHDLSDYLKKNNGTRFTSHNMWNALAEQCDVLTLMKLEGKIAHLSVVGKGCTLGGKKYEEEMLFIGSMRIDAMMWAADLLADTVYAPLPLTPSTTSQYAQVYGEPERLHRDTLKTLITVNESANIADETHKMFSVFGSRMDVWEDTLCYEAIPYPAKGIKTADNLEPNQYGCIWRQNSTSEVQDFFVDGGAAGKYIRQISAWVGWDWHTVDFIWMGSVYIQSQLRMVSYYQVDRSLGDGKDRVSHYIATDFTMNGILYYVLLIVEILIIYINIGDSMAVANHVISPLLQQMKVIPTGSTTKTSDQTSDQTSSQQSSVTPSKQEIKSETKSSQVKNNKALSKVLLYTDLSSVSFHNRSLIALLVIDAILSWIYIIPNSTVFAWSTSIFQTLSAVASNFRVWPVIIIMINWVWCILVWANERVAYVVNHYCYVTAFEIMLATLVAVWLYFSDLLNVCLFKWGIIDRQREMFPTVDGLYSFYNSYSSYAYGDKSYMYDGLYLLYLPLINILLMAVLLSFLSALAKGVFAASIGIAKGTFFRDVSALYKGYNRNSIEKLANSPLRANALVRSQGRMEFNIGNTAYIRSFVYLEQNYCISNGRFQVRPSLPYTNIGRMEFSDETGVEFSTYSLRHLDSSNSAEVQIPLG